MRTKNAKRLWPVPIVAAVAVIGMLALLVATPAVPWGQAEVHAADRTISSPVAAAGCKVNAADANDASCTFRTEQGTLTLTNEVPENEVNWAVYVTGGSDYDIQATNNSSDPADDGTNHLGKKGLGEHLVTIPKRDGFGRDGRVEIPLSRSMSDSDGNVYVFVYAPSVNGVPLSDETDPDSLPGLPGGDVMVRVTFLVEPVRARDSTRDDTAALDYTAEDDVNGSTLLASEASVLRPTDSMGDADEDGYDDMMWVLGDTAGEVTITAAIRDANGNDLDAGDKDSTVVFQIDYVEGSDIGASTLDYSQRVVMMQDTNEAEIMVDGWNASGAPVKPVRVVITATYTGPTALNGFNVGTIVLSRAGAGMNVEAATYSGACINDGNTVDDLTDDTINKKADGCEITTRFGAEETIVVIASVNDALGNDASAGDIEVSGPDSDDAIDEIRTGTNALPTGATAVFMVAKEPMLGDQTITIECGAGCSTDAEDVMLTVSIAGPTASYMINGPERIDLGRSGTFMIQAYDANMSVPHFMDDMPMAEVFIQGLPSGNTRYISSDGMVEIDADTGMGEFTIYAPNGAMDGDTIRIFVGTGDMEQEHTVMFGMATLEMLAPGMPMDVEAVAGSAAGTVDLKWMAGANATQHWILAIRTDGALTGYTWVQASGDSSHTLTGLDSGVAYIFGVNAGNDADEWAGWVFTTGTPN